MRSNQASGSKSKKYIYTEKDLGEGLLEEGVTNPYFLENTNTVNIDNFSNSLKSNNLLRDGINVQEDFTYVYYS